MERWARSRWLRASCAAALLAVGAGERSASAQPATQSSESRGAEERRTALYRAGVEAATAGRWAEAKQSFVAAMAIRPSAKVFFSLAQTEEHLGQVASADADFVRAIESATAAGERDVVAAAEHARAALAPLVPHLRVLVTVSSGGGPGASQRRASDAGTTARLDDQPVAIGIAVAVDPGAHRLVVAAPGMRDAITSVAIGERQQLDVPVQLAAIEPSVEPARPPVEQHTTSPIAHAGPWRTVGLVVMGVGVVGLGVGTYFGVAAKSKVDESNRQGCNGNVCPPDAASTRRDALSAADISTVAFVAGGVLAAGGLVLALTAPSGQAVRVAPAALGGGGGVVVAGGWR
ncbi:MAG: hypothetical protein JWO86_684 [Myxococcaceae bacterium]|nr:hypothetical protein [Myxococcaceae bacterium]